MAPAARPRRRARRTPPTPIAETPVAVTAPETAPKAAQPPPVAEPEPMAIPTGMVTDEQGESLSEEQLAKLPLSKEERDRISLQAALQRAAEIEQSDDRVEGQDKFAFDRSIIPAGWDYQWKTDTVLNQRDPAYRVDLHKAGWRPVPSTRHPEMMPSDWTADYIIRGGQILMEMPMATVEAARLRERRNALEAVRVKEDQLNSTPQNTFSRRGQTSRQYAPMEIPKA